MLIVETNIMYRYMELSDIDLIKNLQQQGVKYLDTLYNDKYFNQEKLIKLQKLYILNGDIFDNSLKQYFSQIVKNSDSSLWINLMESKHITDNNIFDIFGNLMEIMNKKEVSNKTDLIIKTFQNTVFHDRVIQLFFPNDLGNISPLWDYVCYPLFNSVRMGTCNWSIHSSKIFDLVKEIIYENGLLKEFMRWNTTLFNRSTHKINLSIVNIDYDADDNDHILANVLSFILDIWSDMNVDVENDIDFDYIIDANCPIKWMSDSKNTLSTLYNLETELFFLVLFNIRVGYIPVLYRAINWEKSLEKLDRRLNAFSFGMYFKSKITKHIEMDRQIMNNNQLGNIVQTFYVNMIDFFVKYQNKTLDDIYSDFIFFYSNTVDKYDYTVSGKNLQFMIQLCKNDLYTKSTGLKYNCLEFIQLYMENYKKNIEIFPSDILLKHINNFIPVHNKITNFDSGDTYDLNSKLFIYKSFLFYFRELDYLFDPKQLVDTITINNLEFKKFINIVCMDLNEYSEILETLSDEIKTTSRRRVINSNSVSIRDILNRCINILTLIENITDNLLKYDENKGLILSKEILMTIMLSIKSIIKIFYKITNDHRVLIISNEVTFKNKITQIIIHLFNQKINLDYFTDGKDFELKNYQMLRTSDTLSNWDNFLSEIEEYMESYQEETVEVPDEFLDNLTYCPIEEPCLLPNTSGELANTFFDKTTISKQLLIKEENPFTGDQLTTQEFEKYNLLEETKVKHEEFKIRFKKWKEKSHQKDD